MSNEERLSGPNAPPPPDRADEVQRLTDVAPTRPQPPSREALNEETHEALFPSGFDSVRKMVGCSRHSSEEPKTRPAPPGCLGFQRSEGR